MAANKTTEQFINEAQALHGDAYDYSKTIYVNALTKIEIVCRTHGSFWQHPSNHLRPCGCPACFGSKRKTPKQFAEEAVAIHGDTYDYSLVDYLKNTIPVIIKCKKHGAFHQRPDHHLSGHGCVACQAEKAADRITMSHEEFVAQANTTHAGKYSYPEPYTGKANKIGIVCPDHGRFEQTAGSHTLAGTGCPKCASAWGPSKQENEVFDYVKVLCPDAEQSVIGLLEGRQELDIVIPSLKIAIEFNGLIWHSEKYGKDRNYHQRKTDAAKAAGYRLIHIWSDEWRDKRAWCKAFLDRLCGAASRKVYARNCEIKELATKDARQFLDDNHLQGFRSGQHLGLFCDNELVALATHAKNSVGENELIRWCVKLGVSVVGGFSKIMKRLPLDIISFCDTAKHDAAGYLASGWKVDSVSVPSYYYTNGVDRVNRNKMQKHKLLQMPGVSGTTERELANSLGFYQIGGCKQLKLSRA